jgi:hypothetical protein
VFLRHPNNCLENIYIFYLPLFNTVVQNLLLSGKNFGEAFTSPLLTPSVLYPQLTPKDEEINQMMFHYYELLSAIPDQHCFHVLHYFINPHSFFAGSHVHIHRPLVSENNFLLSLSFFPGFEKQLSFVLNCIFH